MTQFRSVFIETHRLLKTVCNDSVGYVTYCMSEDKDFTTTPKDEDGELQLAGAVVRGQFGNSIFISTVSIRHPLRNVIIFFSGRIFK